MTRRRSILASLAPALLLIAAFAVAVMLRGAYWPHGWSMVDLIIFSMASVFLLIKSTLLIRGVEWVKPDYLALSLAAANTAFSALYALIVAATLWPLWFIRRADFVEWLTRGLRVWLICAIAWSVFQLVTEMPEEE